MNITRTILFFLMLTISLNAFSQVDSSVEGKYLASSKACWGNPGDITITSNTISFSDCNNAVYTIIKNLDKNDGFWKGDRKERKAKKYKDITVHIDRTKYCPAENKEFQKYMKEIFRLLVSDDSTILMEYKSRKRLKENSYSTWCVYSKIK